MTQSEFSRVGFIGLGQMGRHMAVNLCKAGVPLTVCSRSGRQFAEFKTLGATATRNFADFAGYDLVFLCLPSTLSVRGTVLGQNGLIRHLQPGAIVVDMSAINHKVTLEMAAALSGAGIAFMDAPVSGSEASAKEGSLTVTAGGDADLFAKLLPYFEKMGRVILHVGAVGNGQLIRLVSQLVLDSAVAALAEVMPLAAVLGLDPAQTASVINAGMGSSYASEYFLSHMLKGQYPGQAMEDAYKDMAQALEISADKRVPLPVVMAAATTYQAALRKGLGRAGRGAMVQVFEELLEVKVRK